MSQNYFSFKQFTVYHDLCAMKVGTDGVLLGAWANCENCGNILDIGTGSGLIALMLAQRSHAEIDAIDIDESAYKQAFGNFENSGFEKRLKAYHADFFQFKPAYSYDLIVSNPPYFVDSLQSPDEQRTGARHTNNLFFSRMIEKSYQILSSKGKLSLILPYESLSTISNIAEKNQFYLSRKTIVRSMENHPPKRVLLEFSKETNSSEEQDIFIEKSRHVYSDAYIRLTRDFYLKM